MPAFISISSCALLRDCVLKCSPSFCSPVTFHLLSVSRLISSSCFPSCELLYKQYLCPLYHFFSNLEYVNFFYNLETLSLVSFFIGALKLKSYLVGSDNPWSININVSTISYSGMHSFVNVFIEYKC